MAPSIRSGTRWWVEMDSNHRKLRKDEPHPVSLLPACAEFAQGGGVDVLLGDDEAVEVHGIAVKGM